MSNEFRHKDAIAGRVRENEYEHIRQHILNDQATGMIVHASDATQLSGLPIGTVNQVLAVSAGGLPEWVSGPTFTTLTLTGKLTLSSSARITTHLEISGTDKLASGEQAIYINFPLETLATNGIWITLGSTVTSGDLTGIRSRVTGNAASAGANVRGAYLEAKVGASKYAAQIEGALIHADYSAGSVTISGDVRGLTVHISQGAGLNAANLYGILLSIQTRGSETITTDDIGLLIRNEAVGGNGRMMDSGLTLTGKNLGGGVRAFAVDITFQGGATIYDDGTSLILAGSILQVGRDDTGVATGAVTNMLRLQAGSGSSNESAGFGLGISILLGNDASEVEERASIDFILTDATNGGEDVKIVWSLMSGGSAVAEKMSLTDEGLLSLTGQILFNDVRLKRGAAGRLDIRNVDDTDHADLICEVVQLQTGVYIAATPGYLRASAGTGGYLTIEAYDTGVGSIEIGRVIGAADPYLRIGRDDLGVATSAVTDMLVLQAGAGSSNESANFGLGISILLGNDASQVEERARLEYVLTDASDGGEDVKIVWKLMTGGGAAAEKMSLTDVGLLTLAGGVTIGGSLTMEAQDLVTDTTTGTKIGTAANQKIGFFGDTPVVQLAKASYNNWVALGDVVNALVAIGLFDAA